MNTASSVPIHFQAVVCFKITLADNKTAYSRSNLTFEEPLTEETLQALACLTKETYEKAYGPVTDIQMIPLADYQKSQNNRFDAMYTDFTETDVTVANCQNRRDHRPYTAFVTKKAKVKIFAPNRDAAEKQLLSLSENNCDDIRYTHTIIEFTEEQS